MDIAMPIAMSLSLTAFNEAIDYLEAPTYVVRVSPVQYSYATLIFSDLWRVAVVADAELQDEEWRIERYDSGKLVSTVINDGV